MKPCLRVYTASSSQINCGLLTLGAILHYSQASVISGFQILLWQSQAKAGLPPGCGSHCGSVSLPCLVLSGASPLQSGLAPDGDAGLACFLLSLAPCSSLF